jgi:1-aminocyclopropane-1-carboxylate deaminase
MDFPELSYSSPPIILLRRKEWPIKPKVYLLREDLSHPNYGGNKYWKLSGNLKQAIHLQKKEVISFGGAYSNHIYALAAACKELNIACTVFVRGDEIKELSPTLQFAKAKGVNLKFISRSTYREWRENKYKVIEAHYPNAYIIPEGGSSIEGIISCATWPKNLQGDFDYIMMPCGTGGSIAGFAYGYSGKAKIMGFSVIKGDFLQTDIQDFQVMAFGETRNNWTLETSFHFGGYAKTTHELLHFIDTFECETGIPLDPVYTSKMIFGIDKMLKSGAFSDAESILIIHTGGLQGRRA